MVTDVEVSASSECFLFRTVPSSTHDYSEKDQLVIIGLIKQSVHFEMLMKNLSIPIEMLIKMSYATATAGDGLENLIGTATKDSPIKAMVGATVIGPTKRMIGPIRPRAPTNTSTEEATIKLPDICEHDRMKVRAMHQT